MLNECEQLNFFKRWCTLRNTKLELLTRGSPSSWNLKNASMRTNWNPWLVMLVPKQKRIDRYIPCARHSITLLNRTGDGSVSHCLMFPTCEGVRVHSLHAIVSQGCLRPARPLAARIVSYIESCYYMLYGICTLLAFYLRQVWRAIWSTYCLWWHGFYLCSCLHYTHTHTHTHIYIFI